MTTELYLIRHGESEMNTTAHLIGGRSNETPLTPHGKEQARLLGNYFATASIFPDRIFASPALRTIQTAEHTLTAMGSSATPIIADELQEMDQGKYVGKIRADIYNTAVFKEIEKQGKDFKLPGAESMNETGARMLRWLQKNVSSSDHAPSERVFVFGHRMAIQSLLSILFDWSRDETFKVASENTSFTLLTQQDGNWHLDSLAVTPHLK